MNGNPYKARIARRSRAKPGDLRALQRRLRGGLLHAETILEHASQEENPELVLRAVHAISQTAGQYAKLLQIGEIESRLRAVEERCL